MYMTQGATCRFPAKLFKSYISKKLSLNSRQLSTWKMCNNKKREHLKYILLIFTFLLIGNINGRSSSEIHYNMV